MGARAFLRHWFLRALLLLLWSLVVWGALLLLVTLTHAVREGPRLALARLLPSHGASIWAWLNAMSAALALGVGVLVGGYLAWAHRGRPAPPSP